MCARDSLLLPAGGPSVEGHRGVWFYDPLVFGHIEKEDSVVFVSGGEVVARGTVREVDVAAAPSEEFRKYCSRVNGRVFQWD
jgi:hypothetical protein